MQGGAGGEWTSVLGDDDEARKANFATVYSG